MNYLALLGWGSPSGDEILDRDRLVAEFTVDRVHDAPAVFDVAKLDWMNQQYIQKLSPDDLVNRVMALYPLTDEPTLRKCVELELIQTRITTLADVPGAIRYLHERPEIDAGAAEKWLGTDEARTTLSTVADRLAALEPWESEAIKTAVQSTIEELGLHRRRGRSRSSSRSRERDGAAAVRVDLSHRPRRSVARLRPPRRLAPRGTRALPLDAASARSIASWLATKWSRRPAVVCRRQL